MFVVVISVSRIRKHVAKKTIEILSQETLQFLVRSKRQFQCLHDSLKDFKTAKPTFLQRELIFICRENDFFLLRFAGLIYAEDQRRPQVLSLSLSRCCTVVFMHSGILSLSLSLSHLVWRKQSSSSSLEVQFARSLSGGDEKRKERIEASVSHKIKGLIHLLWSQPREKRGEIGSR